jgi:hypothetical protein
VACAAAGRQRAVCLTQTKQAKPLRLFSNWPRCTGLKQVKLRRNFLACSQELKKTQ